MNICNKRPCAATAAAPPPQEGFQLPDTVILNEIFPKLELQSLCSVACVCRTLRSIVPTALSTLTSLDLSAFSPNGELLGQIASKFSGANSVTIDCLCLDDCSVINILGPHIQELNLLKCASLSFEILASIGEKCPNLRTLVLDLAGQSYSETFRRNLSKMLKSFHCLEHLSIKVRETERNTMDFAAHIAPFFPETLKSLKLQPVSEHDAVHFINFPQSLGLKKFTLLSLSLVLTLITDRLMFSISNSLNLLVELDLEDRPCAPPRIPQDLTNNGLELLSLCPKLTHLSIVRSRVNSQTYFRNINDLGLMLLSESCGGLESVKLGGFSVVTDAGFSSILRSCYNLKRFEVRNAPFLSDLAFNNIVCPLVEVRLHSCKVVTSDAIAELASSSSLEVLDTCGCRSIADPCLWYVSHLSTLTVLNLGGADITDAGLVLLSKGDLPIVNLCLRGCARVTDRGIICLIKDGEKIKKTLSSLDVGHMPGISDRAVEAIISSAEGLTELCMRFCFHVSDAAFVALASGNCGSKFLEKLDICHTIGFSEGVVELLNGSSFRGLRWLGVCSTPLAKKKDDFGVICRRRPWLTVCFEGCELGCHDGWQFHKQ